MTDNILAIMTGPLLFGFGMPSADLGRAQGVSTAPVPRLDQELSSSLSHRQQQR